MPPLPSAISRVRCAKGIHMIMLTNFRKYPKDAFGAVVHKLMQLPDASATVGKRGFAQLLDLEYFRCALLSRLFQDFALAESDPNHAAYANLFDPAHWVSQEAFNKAFGPPKDISYMFEYPSRFRVLYNLGKNILFEKFDGIFREAVAGGNVAFEIAIHKPTVKELYIGIVDEWVAAAATPLATATESSNAAAAADADEGADGAPDERPPGGEAPKGDDDDNDPPQDDVEKEEFYNQAVNEEMAAYLFAMVPGGSSAADIIDGLQGSHAGWGPLPPGKNRLSMIEGCFYAEDEGKVQAYRGSPFLLKRSCALSKLPKEKMQVMFDVAAHKKNNDRATAGASAAPDERSGESLLQCKDIFICAAAGDLPLQKAFSDTAKANDCGDAVNLMLIHKETEVDARVNYTAGVPFKNPPAKKIRLAYSAELASDVLTIACDGDREFASVMPMFIGEARPTSLAFPVIKDCPLLPPQELLHVYADEKKYYVHQGVDHERRHF